MNIYSEDTKYCVFRYYILFGKMGHVTGKYFWKFVKKKLIIRKITPLIF